MIVVFVNLPRNEEIWGQLETPKDEQGHQGELKAPHYAISKTGAGDATIRSFRSVADIEDLLCDENLFLVTDLAIPKDNLKEVATQLCELSPQYYIHDGDVGQDTLCVEEILEKNGKSAKPYSHTIFDSEWQYLKDVLGPVLQLTPKEIFHRANSFFEPAQLAIDGRDEHDPLSVWDHWTFLMQAHLDDEYWNRLIDSLNAAIDSNEVSELMGELHPWFENLCNRIYTSMALVFPKERPKNISEQDIEKLEMALHDWADLEHQVKEASD